MHRSPRSPFVHTVSLVGIGVGLGASGCGNGGSNDNPQNTGDSATDSTIVGGDEGVVDSGVDVGEVIDAKNPPECPSDDPGFGAKQKPCTAAASVRCSYADPCDLRPVDAGPPLNVYFCHAGTWSLLVDYTPECPAVAPKVGGACPCSPHMLYVACLFGTCEGKDRVYFDCQTADTFETTWKSTPVSCNPPEPDGGLDADAAEGG